MSNPSDLISVINPLDSIPMKLEDLPIFYFSNFGLTLAELTTLRCCSKRIKEKTEKLRRTLLNDLYGVYLADISEYGFYKGQYLVVRSGKLTPEDVASELRCDGGLSIVYLRKYLIVEGEKEKIRREDKEITENLLREEVINGEGVAVERWKSRDLHSDYYVSCTTIEENYWRYKFE